MAIYIRIWKTTSVGTIAEYAFARDVYSADPDRRGMQRWEFSQIGRVLFDSTTGEVSTLQTVDNADFYEQRVKRKLAEHVGTAALPERCDYYA